MKKPLPTWVRDDKSVVACTEKIKVMQENFEEIQQLAQDALEDGLLMEVSEQQMREALHKLVDELINPYQKQFIFVEKDYSYSARSQYLCACQANQYKLANLGRCHNIWPKKSTAVVLVYSHSMVR
jgi:hypothetical protein